VETSKDYKKSHALGMNIYEELNEEQREIVSFGTVPVEIADKYGLGEDMEVSIESRCGFYDGLIAATIRQGGMYHQSLTTEGFNK